METICRRSLTQLAVVCAVILVMAPALAGQNYRNRITFSNLSGEDAVVKVVGPVTERASVPNGSSSTVHVPAGQYYTLVQYCDSNQRCSYTRGNPFGVDETMNQYSNITITLHKVVNGNYGSRPSSNAEFQSH